MQSFLVFSVALLACVSLSSSLECYHCMYLEGETNPDTDCREDKYKSTKMNCDEQVTPPTTAQPPATTDPASTATTDAGTTATTDAGTTATTDGGTTATADPGTTATADPGTTGTTDAGTTATADPGTTATTDPATTATTDAGTTATPDAGTTATADAGTTGTTDAGTTATTGAGTTATTDAGTTATTDAGTTATTDPDATETTDPGTTATTDPGTTAKIDNTGDVDGSNRVRRAASGVQVNEKYCAKYIGKSGNKEVVIRECAIRPVAVNLTCTNDTPFIPSTPEFADKVRLIRSRVCYCNGDLCNSSSMISVAPFLISLLGILFHQNLF